MIAELADGEEEAASLKQKMRENESEWRKVVVCGLDPESAQKVFRETPDGGTDEFTSYALAGLRNFYSQNPSKFIALLAKGPPPAYRWLAWKFIGSIILTKDKGAYERYLKQGKEGMEGNSYNSRCINNDVNRTFPFHQYFRRPADQADGDGQKPLRNVLLAYSEYC